MWWRSRARSPRNPKVLFLDEPTEPLQQADVRKLFDLIEELKRDGVGIVYVSHRLHEVDELADRISVMRDGEIIDSRMADSITPAEIVALIAGRPLGQIFPAKAKIVGAPLFEVSGLSGRGFDQVDLTVHAGEIVGLAGVEGEGQREFIRAAAGIDRHSGGEVSVARVKIAGDSPGAFRASRHRIYFRRSPPRRRVSQSDAARESQPRLPASGLA